MIDPTEIDLNNLGMLPKLVTPIKPTEKQGLLNLFLAVSVFTLFWSIYKFKKQSRADEIDKQRRDLRKSIQ